MSTLFHMPIPTQSASKLGCQTTWKSSTDSLKQSKPHSSDIRIKMSSISMFHPKRQNQRQLHSWVDQSQPLIMSIPASRSTAWILRRLVTNLNHECLIFPRILSRVVLTQYMWNDKNKVQPLLPYYSLLS